MVEVAMIYPRCKGDNAYGWFRDRAVRHGLSLEILFWDRLDPGRMHLPDIAVMRGYNIALSRYLESSGVRVVNASSAMALSRNKLECQRVLEAASIPVPALLSLQQSLPEKYVLKQYFGSKGEGVALISSPQHRQAAEERFAAVQRQRLAAFEQDPVLNCENGESPEEIRQGCRWLAQEYIASSRGRDVRVWVVGDRAVGAVLRSNPGHFRSNFAQGGQALPVRLTREIEEVAVSAAKAVGVEFAGIDLLFTDAGFLVCEVNGNAGFRTASLVGGIDVPDALMSYLAASAGK